jgi:hypothetical protein
MFLILIIVSILTTNIVVNISIDVLLLFLISPQSIILPLPNLIDYSITNYSFINTTLICLQLTPPIMFVTNSELYLHI